MDDHYKTLQVDPTADAEVVQAAYRQLARKYHPDVSTEPNARLRMVSINRAYEVLGDAFKRRAYDSELGSAASGRISGVPTPTPPASPDTALNLNPASVYERIKMWLFVRWLDFMVGALFMVVFQAVTPFSPVTFPANDSFSAAVCYAVGYLINRSIMVFAERKG